MSQPKVEIGTPGYYAIGSDAYPVTLVDTKRNGKVLVIQYDTFIGDADNGHNYFGNQVWKFERNENGRLEEVVWKPSRNRFGPVGQSVGGVFFGKWHAKQDPSF